MLLSAENELEPFLSCPPPTKPTQPNHTSPQPLHHNQSPLQPQIQTKLTVSNTTYANNGCATPLCLQVTNESVNTH